MWRPVRACDSGLVAESVWQQEAGGRVVELWCGDQCARVTAGWSHSVCGVILLLCFAIYVCECPCVRVCFRVWQSRRCEVNTARERNDCKF